jgi:hypothetical protein
MAALCHAFWPSIECFHRRRPMVSRYSRFKCKLGIDVALEPLRKDPLGELGQRPETARVPLPNVFDAAIVGVAEAMLELQIERLPEQLPDPPRIASSQRDEGGSRCVVVLGKDAKELRSRSPPAPKSSEPSGRQHGTHAPTRRRPVPERDVRLLWRPPPGPFFI